MDQLQGEGSEEGVDAAYKARSGSWIGATAPTGSAPRMGPKSRLEMLIESGWPTQVPGITPLALASGYVDLCGFNSKHPSKGHKLWGFSFARGQGKQGPFGWSPEPDFLVFPTKLRAGAPFRLLSPIPVSGC